MIFSLPIVRDSRTVARMSTAARIIGLFGGTREAARKLDRPKSTVQSWKTKGRIPAHDQQHVLDRARIHGIPVTPASFFEGESHPAADHNRSENSVQAPNGAGERRAF